MERNHPAIVSQADRAQVIVREGLEIRAEHGAGQRNVLLRIIQHAQEIERGADFRSVKISGGEIRVHRNSAARQRAGEYHRLIFHRTKQHGDVAVFERIRFPILPHDGSLLGHQRSDTLRHHAGFFFNSREIFPPPFWQRRFR